MPDNEKPGRTTQQQLFMLAGFIVQIPMSMLAFGLIGAWANSRFHIHWALIVGVFVGLLIGAAGLVALIKKVNGGT